MKKTLLWGLAPLLLVAVPALAQESGAGRKYATLLYAYDLDGEAADADQVVTAVTIADSKSDYTITAQPDVCRLLVATIVDTNINSGTLTITGTGCLGEARVCSFAFTSGDDTGAKTLTCTDGEGAYFSSVTSAATGVMDGDSDETFALGYTANSVNGWPMYGRLVPGPMGEGMVDPFQFFEVPGLPITTSGSLSTTVTAVSSNAAFTNVSVGDLLLISYKGAVYERKVTARASANSITVNAAVNIEAAGTPFKFKKMYYSTNPADQMVIPVGGWDSLMVNWSVDANADTGGVITLFDCIDSKQPDYPASPWVAISTTTTNSGSTQVPKAETVDLTTTPYAYCRFGFRFGTGDDGDGANEDINLSVVLSKR